MSDTIDYGNLMHDAMRDLIRKVLDEVARDGLPGEHHFFINFDTRADGVDIADWMQDRFPDDMTIVLQHWFEDLTVREHDFSVTLNFGDAPQSLTVPYDAINTFVDPSVEFGLRFELQENHHPDLHIAGEDEPETSDDTPKTDQPEMETQPPAPKDAEIVSLDSFRKP